MTEKTRNLMVGLTVLVGLALLSGMILIFQELPSFLRVGYGVKVRAADTLGVGPGADVLMAGKRIGRVAGVEFVDPGDPRKGIVFALVIDRDVRVPGDVNVYIQGRGFGGGGAVQFRSDGTEPGASRKDPETGMPLEWIPQDRVLVLDAKVEDSGGGGLLPSDLVADLRGAMDSIERLANSLDGFLAFPPPAAPPEPSPTTEPGAAERRQPTNIHVTMRKLNTALDAVNNILADKDSQRNLKEGLAKFRSAAEATEKAAREAADLVQSAKGTLRTVSDATTAASEKFQDLAARLLDDADRLGKVLTNLNRATAKIDSGKGTAGKLINDPALYNNLVDAAAALNSTLNKLQELLEIWNQRGIPIKAKL